MAVQRRIVKPAAPAFLEPGAPSSRAGLSLPCADWRAASRSLSPRSWPGAPGDPAASSPSWVCLRRNSLDSSLRRPICVARGCRHRRSGSSIGWSSGSVTGCGVGCGSDPPPRVEGSRGPRARTAFSHLLLEPRGNARKGGELPRMSVRRRWRIAWVRRSLGSPACRAVVLPRARFAD